MPGKQRQGKMTNRQDQTVDFLGHQIECVQDVDGTVYMPLKRLCESLRIDYEGQRSILRNSKTFHTELMSVPGTDGKKSKMLCLPVAAIGDWASTIDPNTVLPEVLETLRGYLEGRDEFSEGIETRDATANSGIAEITTEEGRKELAYNCLGNLNWFLDAFLLWARELADNNGDYFPGDDIVKASPEEVREYVRRVGCNIRVLQAIIDASIQYENLDCPVDEHELIKFHNESAKLWRSTNELLQPFDGRGSGQGESGHSYMDYLCGPALDAMTELGGEIIMNFHEKIIPRKKR